MITKQRIYYPQTTYSQRQLLFQTWQETGSINEACKRARISRRTFYYWKERFEQGGYEALQEPEKPGTKKGIQIPLDIQEKVKALKIAHSDWGKRRIADELCKSNDWIPLISPNSVRRILQENGLWPEAEPAKKKARLTTVTAPEPGQTINIDLCFVPVAHETEVKLPAVSGSSGKLVIEHTSDETEEKWHPGQIFAQPDVQYEGAMKQFVADSQLETSQVEVMPSPQATARAHKKAAKKAVRQQAEALKIERRKQRQKRQAEDELWREKRAAQREADEKRKQEREAGRRAAYGSQKAHKEEKKKQLEQRRSQKEQRCQEDEAWRQARQEIRQSQQTTALVMGWIAILVITDNCTRRCIGLPLFIAGSRVTAELVVAALRALLPPELQFLISDRGVHFTAKVFQQLAQESAFVHVLIARHRPQSNGIAERFVRTLKEWLKDKSWESAAELEALLIQFRLEYNDRPHQGLPVRGLSPNEYARRLEVVPCVTNP